MDAAEAAGEDEATWVADTEGDLEPVWFRLVDREVRDAGVRFTTGGAISITKSVSVSSGVGGRKGTVLPVMVRGFFSTAGEVVSGPFLASLSIRSAV